MYTTRIADNNSVFFVLIKLGHSSEYSTHYLHIFFQIKIRKKENELHTCFENPHITKYKAQLETYNPSGAIRTWISGGVVGITT